MARQLFVSKFGILVCECNFAKEDTMTIDCVSWLFGLLINLLIS